MEREGIKVDRDYLPDCRAPFQPKIAKLEEQIYVVAEGPFTIGSPQQLGAVLYDRLGLKGGRKGKNGNYSTDVNELERLGSEGVEVARLVLDWRQLTKLKNTYTDALQAQINPGTGRVHTSYRPVGCTNRAVELHRAEPTEYSDPDELGRQSETPSLPSRAMS